MFKKTTLGCLAAAACGIWMIVGVASPQGRLLRRIAGGAFRSAPVDVQTFSPVSSPGEWVPVRVGALSFRVPGMQAPCSQRPFEVEEAAVSLQCTGLGLIAHRPQAQGALSLRREFAEDATFTNMDEVSIRAAAYAADPARASMWMSCEEAERLEALLTARAMLPPRVERVELLWADGIKGVVVTRDFGGDCVFLVYEYFSPHERLSGTAVFAVRRDDAASLLQARAIISSFRFVNDAPRDDAGAMH